MTNNDLTALRNTIEYHTRRLRLLQEEHRQETGQAYRVPIRLTESEAEALRKLEADEAKRRTQLAAHEAEVGIRPDGGFMTGA